MHSTAVVLALSTVILIVSSAQNRFFREADYRQLYPLLSIAIRLQNHAHALPYFFGLLENLDYPKDQILLDVYVGTHIDATLLKTKQWINDAEKYYRSIFLVDDAKNWQEEALMKARNSKAKYVLYLKGDHLLTDHRILQTLMRKKKLTIAPLLFAPYGDPPTVFVSEDYNNRREIATVEVKVVPEPLLIDLAHSDSSFLTFSSENLYGYSKNDSEEPSAVFENSASRMNIPFYVDNEYFYGYFFNHSLRSLGFQRKALRYLLADWIADSGLMPIVHSSFLKVTYPKASLFDVDKIYVINLERRNDRKAKMMELLKLMGYEYTWWKATDGHHLDSEHLYKEIKFLPGYEDPYYKRPMKKGEVGCFLSHYRIWQEVDEKKLSRVIVFEDDLRFSINSTDLLKELIEDIDNSGIEWDLIYLGRKRLEGANENWVAGHRHLSTVDYSYWTLGYMLSLNGARKLLGGDPLKKLVPVDEYIPIMFNKHPNTTWANAFPHRNLIAYTIYPTIVVPERYTYQHGYLSDTEDSDIVDLATATFTSKKTNKDEL
uniref:Glycosyltransferase 25 family member n=1 Tax=Elaeophora elaphi TaxID=1147741 RepID=A0A0R3RHK0_9BILA